MGAVNALMPLLVCDLPKIQLPALLCYATMSFQNGAVSLAMKSGKWDPNTFESCQISWLSSVGNDFTLLSRTASNSMHAKF